MNHLKDPHFILDVHLQFGVQAAAIHRDNEWGDGGGREEREAGGSTRRRRVLALALVVRVLVTKGSSSKGYS